MPVVGIGIGALIAVVAVGGVSVLLYSEYSWRGPIYGLLLPSLVIWGLQELLMALKFL
jgi:hypothetical protein